MPRKANQFSCKPQKRDPPCKKCTQRKGSQCAFVLGETVKERLVLSPYELKSLLLDPSALNRCTSEIRFEKPPSSCREEQAEKPPARAEEKPDRYAASGKIAGGLTCGRKQREYATCK